MVPDSTPPRFVNSQLVSLPPVGIFNKFLLVIYGICLLISVSTISTTMLNILHFDNIVIYFIMFVSSRTSLRSVQTM